MNTVITSSCLRAQIPSAFMVIGFLHILLNRPVLYEQHFSHLHSVTLPAHVVDVLRPVNASRQHERQLEDHKNLSPIHGIDVSHYQGNIDWSTVASSNIRFAYIKASEGITYRDPRFRSNAENIAKTNLVYGAYHFFDAEDDPEQQLQNFVAAIKDTGINLTPMVDIELSHNQPAAIIQQRLHHFLTGLEEKTGCRPIIYSYGAFWHSYLGTAFNHYPFWLADYAKQPDIPAGLENWHIWQYSEKGTVPGIDQAVDLDVMLEGEQQLSKLQCGYPKLI